jgi:hypothetical protein
MDDDKKETSVQSLAVGSTTFDLKGRQSVRATFRLSESCISAITILAAHLGIKQKSVFDHLMEDPILLKDIARELEDVRFSHGKRVQKTFVVSRRSLGRLEATSSTYNTSRDALVEYSVQRLLPIISKEKKKHHIRKEILGRMDEHFQEGKALLKEAGSKLGTEDMMFYRLEAVMNAYQHAYEVLASFIERGKCIEDFMEKM